MVDLLSKSTDGLVSPFHKFDRPRVKVTYQSVTHDSNVLRSVTQKLRLR